MALITNSSYKPPFWLINGHFDTIYPALFRKIPDDASKENISIKTPDCDSFGINYYNRNADKTVIISHGLEGNNTRPYVLGMAKTFCDHGWNVIAWNYRGCDGKTNNSIRSYHSGFTEDLIETIKFADRKNIKTISFIGFSLGGNLTLKYLGNGKRINSKVKNAVVFSVPLDLYRGCLKISKPGNLIYAQRFLNSLKKKVKEKSKRFPEIDTTHLSKIRDLKTFDDYYTAPMHGFKDAMDYYNSCSALYVLDQIKTPTLIVNALNDPFLPIDCYPSERLRDHPWVHLETPERGGHVGFCSNNGLSYYWSEQRALEFISSTL
ncbi:MAG: alpha/beta fold hydrolase [Cytophagales bacterium]|nr:alpha/beta fold hydrolase [Cytophagales bacterium]